MQGTESAEVIGGPLDIPAFQAVAIRQRTAIVVYSQIESCRLLVWVLRSSDGALTARSLTIPRDDFSLTQLVMYDLSLTQYQETINQVITRTTLINSN